MTCAQRDGDLQALLDGELEPSRALRLQQHLAECLLCQRRLRFFEEVRSALRAQATAQKAPPHVKERIEGSLQQFERRRCLSWKAAAAILVVVLLGSLAGVFWLSTSDEAAPLLAELVSAHAALVRGERPLAYASADAHAVQRWLAERLPFRPFVPRAALAGFQLLGAQTLSLANRQGAFLLFANADHRVSLLSLLDPGNLPAPARQVAIEGTPFQIFTQDGYTLVLWRDHGLLYALVSDDDAEELLEYARLCVLQMRSPAG